MDRYHASLSRTIAPAELGRRMRAARLAAGMTQAEVAAGDVTAAYVSRLERGERRPTPRLLDRIAKRLDVTPAVLLAAHSPNEPRARALRVEQAAVLVATGEWLRGEALASEVLGELESHEDEALRAAALRVKGEALFGLGAVTSAISVGEGIVGDRDFNSLRALILLCRCHTALGAPERAIAVGQVGETVLHSLELDGLGESLSLAAAVARAHALQGRFASATLVCRDALAAAAHLPADVDATRYLRAAAAEVSTGGATPAALELTTAALTILETRNSLTELRGLLAELP